MKALLYTSDPYEPSGVIGLFETEQQKQDILQQYTEQQTKKILNPLNPTYNGMKEALKSEITQNSLNSIKQDILSFTEIEIPIGIYGEYY